MDWRQPPGYTWCMREGAIVRTDPVTQRHVLGHGPCPGPHRTVAIVCTVEEYPFPRARINRRRR